MSTVNVATAEQLITAINTETTENTTIKVIGDIDFNSGPYSDWEDNFFVPTSSSAPSYTTTLDGSLEDSQGNTPNRTISNIFIYPDKCLFYNKYSTSNKIICKNLTFEIVNNGGYLCDTRSKKCIFENCIFNVRLFSNNYVQFFASNDRLEGILTFKNCVFNFYISSSIGNITLIKAPASNSGSDVYPVIIKSCIFKIRNATNKFITLVENTGNYYTPAKIYNSAIFYNDVGTVQPPYSLNKDDNKMIRKCHHITSPTVCVKNRIMNTYISSFDCYPLPTGFVKPIIVAFNYEDINGSRITDIINTSFYDGSKIDVYMNYINDNSTIIDNYTGFCTKLTTEQCKDPAKLSEIGYIFSEEI